MNESDYRLLLALVKSKRRQYGLIKDQFSKNIISYIRAINSVRAKLERLVPK